MEGTESTVFPWPSRWADAAVTVGENIMPAFRPLLVSYDEESLLPEPREGLVVAAPKNSSAAVSRTDEEARILSNPDVVAAVEAALPDLEAWEQTL
jgi:hypothetical protein